MESWGVFLRSALRLSMGWAAKEVRKREKMSKRVERKKGEFMKCRPQNYGFLTTGGGICND